MWRGNSWFRSGICLAVVGSLASTVACGDDEPITSKPNKGGSSGAAGSAGAAGSVSGASGAAGSSTGGAAGSGTAGMTAGGMTGNAGSAGAAVAGSAGDAMGGEGGEGFGGEGGESGTTGAGMGGVPMGGRGGAGAGGAGAGGKAGGGAGGAGAGGAGAGGAGAGGKAGGGAGGKAGGGAGGAGAGGASGGLGGSGGAPPIAPNLYFSEYIESGTNADAFEVFNGNALNTPAVDLMGCEIRVHYGAVAAAGASVTISGMLPAGGVYVVCLTRIATACDAHPLVGALNDLSGDDAVELACPVGGTMTTLDVIGQYGAGLDPGMEWGGMGMLPGTQNQTLRRRCSVTTGDRNATDAFVPDTGWRGFDATDVRGLGARTCPCAMTDLTCP